MNNARLTKGVFMGAMLFTFFTLPPSVHAKDPITVDDLTDKLAKTQEILNEERAKFLPATSAGAVEIDLMINEIEKTLSHAQKQIEANNIGDAAEAMSVVYGLTVSAIGKLPKTDEMGLKGLSEDAEAFEKTRGDLVAKGLDAKDVEHIRDFVKNMGDARAAEIDKLGLENISTSALEGMKAGGFDVSRLERSLKDMDVDVGDVTSSIKLDLTNFASFSRSITRVLNDPSFTRMLNDPSVLGDISFALGDFGGSLQYTADAIAGAIAYGVNVDLESAAKGAGYSSFSEAVKAYNKAHGTNYSVQQAKDALGK